MHSLFYCLGVFDHSYLPVIILNWCLPEGSLVTLALFLYIIPVCVLKIGFLLSFTDWQKNFTWGKDKGYFAETCHRVLPGIKSLAPSEPDNKQYYKHHSLPNSISVFHSDFMMNIFMANTLFIRLLEANICWLQKMIIIRCTQTCTYYPWVIGMK